MFDTHNETLHTVNKVLVVCSIISIFVTNLFFMYQKAKKEGLKYSPYRMITMSLAFSDVYLAVFSLIVKAVVIFEGSQRFRGCDLFKAVEVYLNYFIHFVYGTGLVLLSLELVIVDKIDHPFFDIRSNKILSISYSLLHWILGLLVVPALTMHGTTGTVNKDGEHQDCFGNASPQRIVAMNVVSVILPATLAVFVSVVVMFDNLPTPAKPATSAVPTPEEKVYPSFSVATAPLTYRHIYSKSDIHVRRSRMFCLMSFVFALCVIPRAAHTVSRAYSSTSANHGAVYFLCLWMSVLRSLITPLICIMCDTNVD